MSLFSRALAGAGGAVSELGNKYLDQQLQTQKAQALAELQRSYAVQTEKDLDAVRNDPARRDRLRAEAGKDAAVASAAALEADAARATDPRIRQGAVDTATATAAAQAAAQRDATIAGGNNPVYLDAAKKVAAATRTPESSASLAQAELMRTQNAIEKLKVGAAQKISSLNDAISVAVQSGDKETEKALRAQKDVFENGPGQKAKLMAAIEEANKTITPAMKVLADTMSSPSAQKEAEETIRQARLRIDQYSKELGLDTAKTEWPGAPAAGTVKNGFSFKGGDPNDKKNWEPAAKKPAAQQKPGEVEKDWVGPGWSYNGRSYPTKQEADAAKAVDESRLQQQMPLMQRGRMQGR